MRRVRKPEFQRRALIVDGDENFLKECAATFRDNAYDILTARDGFEALQVLRGAIPDLLITELSLPRLSGFELLSIVRVRFPQIAIIAVSHEYTTFTVPNEVIADGFVERGPNALFELAGMARAIIAGSTIRSSRTKSQLAPVWIPRSHTGYIILTCTECLRSFSIPQRAADAKNPMRETCLSCGSTVHFWLSATDIVQAPEKLSPLAKAQQLRKKAQDARAVADDLILRSRVLRERRK